MHAQLLEREVPGDRRSHAVAEGVAGREHAHRPSPAGAELTGKCREGAWPLQALAIVRRHHREVAGAADQGFRPVERGARGRAEAREAVLADPDDGEPGAFRGLPMLRAIAWIPLVPPPGIGARAVRVRVRNARFAWSFHVPPALVRLSRSPPPPSCPRRNVIPGKRETIAGMPCVTAPPRSLPPAGSLPAPRDRVERRRRRRAPAAAAVEGEEGRRFGHSCERALRFRRAHEPDREGEDDGGPGRRGIAEDLEEPEERGRRVADDHQCALEMRAPQVHRGGGTRGARAPREPPRPRDRRRSSAPRWRRAGAGG